MARPRAAASAGLVALGALLLAAMLPPPATARPRGADGGRPGRTLLHTRGGGAGWIRSGEKEEAFPEEDVRPKEPVPAVRHDRHLTEAIPEPAAERCDPGPPRSAAPSTCKPEFFGRAGAEPIVMFSGPSQASTLFSEAVIKKFKYQSPKLKKSCPPEFFNYHCHDKHNKGALANKLTYKCIGHYAGWTLCDEGLVGQNLELLHADGAKFVKEIFANGDTLLKFSRAGCRVFVFFRMPQHTFPLGKPWYQELWNGLMKTRDATLMKMYAGDSLVKLKRQAASIARGYKQHKDVQDCLSHYLHFWHLLHVADQNDIPIVKAEPLLLSKDPYEELDRAGFCSSVLDEPRCRSFSSELHKDSKRPTHRHSHVPVGLTPGQSVSSAIFSQKEETYARSVCVPAVKRLMSFCEENVCNCKRVNEIFAGKSGGRHNSHHEMRHEKDTFH